MMFMSAVFLVFAIACFVLGVISSFGVDWYCKMNDFENARAEGVMMGVALKVAVLSACISILLWVVARIAA